MLNYLKNNPGVRIILIGALANLLLATLKIAGGIVGRSTAMVADGIHSLSDLLTDGDVDPYTLLDSMSIVNARIGFSWGDSGSEVVLWGRNLTDERYYAGSFDAPVQSGRMNSYPAEPRTYGLAIGYKFQ